jgi:DNA-directed RNA polymerase alpha subunit
MISAPDKTELRFSEDARRAIASGVQRDHPVANLEYLGMTLRTINILENSEHQITKLAQLVGMSREALTAVPNVTAAVMDEILTCLSRYHELEAERRKIPPVTPGPQHNRR